MGWTRCVVHSRGQYQVLYGMDQVCGAQCGPVPGAMWDGPGVWWTVSASTRCYMGWTRCVVDSVGRYKVLYGMDQVDHIASNRGQE